MLSTACETDHIGKVLQIRRHEHTLLKYTLRKHACKRTHVVTKDQRTVTAPHNQGLAALSGHGWEASGVPGPLELFSGWGCTWTQRRSGQRTHALRQRNSETTRAVHGAAQPGPGSPLRAWMGGQWCGWVIGAALRIGVYMEAAAQRTHALRQQW